MEEENQVNENEQLRKGQLLISLLLLQQHGLYLKMCSVKISFLATHQINFQQKKNPHHRPQEKNLYLKKWSQSWGMRLRLKEKCAFFWATEFQAVGIWKWLYWRKNVNNCYFWNVRSNKARIRRWSIKINLHLRGQDRRKKCSNVFVSLNLNEKSD